MSLEQRKRFTVITNTDFENKTDNTKTPPGERTKKILNESGGGYHTNPMYEKLLQYELEQKRKRFTVDDLLKW